MLGGYTAFVYLALLTPPLYVLILAVSPNPVPGHVGTGFTLQWISSAFSDSSLLENLLITTEIAFWTALLATLIGLTTAKVYLRIDAFQESFLALILLPALVPGVVYGLSLSVLLQTLSIDTSTLTIVLGELAWTLPFATILILTGYSSFDRRLREASADLGASSLQTFSFVELPIVWPGLLGAFLFSFLLAFNEYIRGFFLQGSEGTLPVLLYSRINAGGLTNEMYGLSAVTVVITLIFLGLIYLIQRTNTTNTNPDS